MKRATLNSVSWCTTRVVTMILLVGTRSGFFQRGGEGLIGFVYSDSMAGKHSDSVAEMLLDPGADMCPPGEVRYHS